jgi:RimJ/RimL family protein N-acetyltransferase
MSDSPLALTPFTEDDAAALVEADADPEHRRRFELPSDFVPSLAHSRRVIARWAEERAARTRFPFAVRDSATGELLGGVELRPLGSDSASLSYWTFAKHRGRGVASRAAALACELGFGELGLRRIEAAVDPDNHTSHRVALRAGFTRVGERDGRVAYAHIGPHADGVIRAATAADVSALSTLARETWSDAFGQSLAADDVAAHLEKNLSPESFARYLADDVVLVAELGGRVVGYAHLSPGELRRLYVRRELQGRGIGARLMRAALEQPCLRDAASVSLDVWRENLGAQRFYGRFGFEVTGERRFQVASGAETTPDLVMTRRR